MEDTETIQDVPTLPKGYTAVKQSEIPSLPKGYSFVKKKASSPASPSTSPSSETGSQTSQSSPENTDFTHGYKPTSEDIKTKQSYDDQQKSFETTPEQRKLSDQLNVAQQAYESHLTPQEHATLNQTQQAIQNRPKDTLRQPSKKEIDAQHAMDSTVGKITKSLEYVGSETSKGGLDILKGGAWVLNHMNTGLSDTQLIPDKAFAAADKVTDLGVTPGQREQIESGKGVGWGSVRTLGMLGNIAPAAIGGEAAEIPKTMFALQGIGQGKNTMDAVDPDHKLNPAVRDLYVAGSGLVNGLIVGDLGENFLSKSVQDKVGSAIVSHAMQDSAEKGLTEDAVKTAAKDATKDFTNLVHTYAEKTGKAGIDLAALQAAQYVLKKGVDVASDEPVFNENLGKLMDNISDIVTKQAPLFGGVGAMLEGKAKDPNEVEKRDLGEQIQAKDAQISQLSEKTIDPVKNAENEVNLEQATKDREELNNKLKQLIVKQHETKNEGDAGHPAKTEESDATAQQTGKDDSAVHPEREHGQEGLTQSGEAAAEPVLKNQDENEPTAKEKNNPSKSEPDKKDTTEVTADKPGSGDRDAQDEETQRVKKTILTKRAYEGTIQEDVKKHLEEKGLTRKSFSQEERSKQATDFIGKFGDDATYQAIKSNDVEGGLAASALAQLQIKNNKAMQDLPIDSPEREVLAKKQADYISLMEKKGYLGGEFNGQLAHEYQNAELDYANVKKQVEDLTSKPLSSEQEKKVKTLVSENEKLKKQSEETEAKLIEETDKAFKSGYESAKNETKTEKTKRIATKLRSLKIKSINDATLGIPVAIYNGALETSATLLESGGKLADAIDAGIAHIKDTDWYKSLSNDKQNKVESDFKRLSHDNSGSTDLSDLQERFVDKKDNKFTPSEARDVWGYMKNTYLENGASIRDGISKTAEDLGLSWRQVSEAITTPKTLRISDEMWKKQADYARNRAAIKNWVSEQNKSPVGKAIQKVSGLFRGVAVFGHGGIFIGTHAGMTVFNPSTWSKVIPAFFRGWKFAYGNEAKYERAMEELQHQPNYLIAQRAGLKNNPERINTEEYQKSQKYLGKLGLAGERGFNAIKVLRQDLFDYNFNKLTPAERDDPTVAKSIAHIVNLATGATNLNIPAWVNEVSFAGGMEAARWEKLTASPIKATKTALNAIINPSKSSVSDKVFAKVWARRVGEQLATYSAALLANAAIQNTLNPTNPVNFTNPNKPDFLKFKFGSTTIDPTSGMRSTAMFMHTLAKIPFEGKKELRGEKRINVLGKDVAGYARGKLSPLYGTAADFFSSQDYSGNIMPYSSDKPKKNAHKLTWGEYALSKSPLPVAEAVGVAYKSAIEHGAHKNTLDAVLKGIMSGAISVTTGFRVGEYNNDFSIKKK